MTTTHETILELVAENDRLKQKLALAKQKIADLMVYIKAENLRRPLKSRIDKAYVELNLPKGEG